jgi:imidazolonepropionase-like amidohydrolase
VIELADSTAMPGFIDAHIYIAAKLPSTTNATEDWLTEAAIAN